MTLPKSNKSIRLQITALKAIVGPDDCEILEDPAGADFQEYAKRWTDIGRETPAAIALPRTEDSIQKIVQWAVNSSIPFVAKSGGCSEWSTIGDSGLIIDLTHYSAIEVDAKARTATIRGGVVQKEAAVRLAEEGLFTGEGYNRYGAPGNLSKSNTDDFLSSGQRKCGWSHRLRAWWRFSNHKFHHRLRVRPDHLSSFGDRERRAIGSYSGPTR